MKEASNQLEKKLYLYDNLDLIKDRYNTTYKRLSYLLGIDYSVFKMQKQLNIDTYYRYYKNYDAFAKKLGIKIDDLFYQKLDTVKKGGNMSGRKYYCDKDLWSAVKDFLLDPDNRERWYSLTTFVIDVLKNAIDAGDIDVRSEDGGRIKIIMHYNESWPIQAPRSPKIDPNKSTKAQSGIDSKGNWSPVIKGDRIINSEDPYLKFIIADDDKEKEKELMNIIAEHLFCITFGGDVDDQIYRDIFVWDFLYDKNYSFMRKTNMYSGNKDDYRKRRVEAYYVIPSELRRSFY